MSGRIRTYRVSFIRTSQSVFRKLSRNGLGIPVYLTGTGVSDFSGILRKSKNQNFEGNISIEYEYNWADNLADVIKSIDFIRGFSTVNKSLN